MTSWTSTTFQATGVNYTLRVGLDWAGASKGDLGVWFGKGSDLEVAADLFRESMTRAMNELVEGLKRGGVASAQANIHPRTYIDDVRTFLHQIGWGKPISGAGVQGQTVWRRLENWQPNPDRFLTWFGQAATAGPPPRKQWFRHTVLGTLLGMLADECHRFRFTTGETGTLGSTMPRFNHRVYFRMPKVLHSIRTGNQALAPLQRLQAGDWDYHPGALQLFTLTLINERDQFSSHVISLKRPSKLEKREGDTWRQLWRQTVFHESSHAYANTDDYYYFKRDPATNQFYWFTDSACRTNAQAVAGNAPWLNPPHHGAIGSVKPATSDPDIPLANADSVAAYLCGWHSPAQYPYG